MDCRYEMHPLPSVLLTYQRNPLFLSFGLIPETTKKEMIKPASEMTTLPSGFTLILLDTKYLPHFSCRFLE